MDHVTSLFPAIRPLSVADIYRLPSLHLAIDCSNHTRASPRDSCMHHNVTSPLQNAIALTRLDMR